jgi:predicted Zn finger-like uncharacterized protein
MGSFDSRGVPIDRSVVAPVVTQTPAGCPTCRSSAIVTTAKSPDSTSYWRCTNCGDVWNDARRDAERRGGRRWR